MNGRTEIRIGTVWIAMLTLVLVVGGSRALRAEPAPTFVREWGVGGTSPGQLYDARGITVDPEGHIFVVNKANHRIQEFAPDGVLLNYWGTFGSGPGQFRNPWGIVSDPDGNLYVVDSENDRVQKFTNDGTYLLQWGGTGSGPGQFQWPRIGIALDSEGNVIVSDTGGGPVVGNRVQKFTPEGTFLLEWGSSGSGPGLFDHPHGIATSPAPDCFVYVADAGNSNRIQKFDCSGSFVDDWSGTGSAPGQINRSRGMAADTAGNVYIADRDNHRIQKFAPDGTLLWTFGERGAGPGQFEYPRGIAVAEDGLIYVVDTGNSRVQVLRPSTVAVRGTVTSDCQGGVAWITVDLHLPGLSDLLTTVTNSDGAFEFLDVAYDPLGGDLSIVVPLGFEAITPADGHVSVDLAADHQHDFVLHCGDPVNLARSIGYWKHQANSWLTGRGHAQESQVDMETTFPAAVFQHFYENGLVSIAVEGVTYMGFPAEPLDLGTMSSTLSVKGNTGMLDRAKQHYLALLLNVASGKLSTTTVATEDGRTVSQALQFVADFINDGDPTNDEVAKDVCDAINDAGLVAAGVVPDGYGQIAYVVPRERITGFSMHPNPARSTAAQFSFRLDQPSLVRLDVFDVGGRRIARSDIREYAGGTHVMSWSDLILETPNIARGVYFARISAGRQTRDLKITWLRQ
jgi:DNA-binding beta-propeller fold protein YncE